MYGFSRSTSSRLCPQLINSAERRVAEAEGDHHTDDHLVAIKCDVSPCHRGSNRSFPNGLGTALCLWRPRSKSRRRLTALADRFRATPTDDLPEARKSSNRLSSSSVQGFFKVLIHLKCATGSIVPGHWNERGVRPLRTGLFRTQGVVRYAQTNTSNRCDRGFFSVSYFGFFTINRNRTGRRPGG